MIVPASALLIGIDKYPKPFPTLSSAVKDAKAMESLLKSDLGMTKGVTLLTDADATKENIINAIQSLKPVVSGRDEFILIFFSGIAARARTPDASDGQSTMGLICPVDAYETGGISDGALLQLLDQVAKERGRNICVFLDCSGGIFSWEIPQSCTIYAPSKADETAAGGAFTQAVLRTFREHKDKLDQMTHWALRGAIQTAMTKTTVYCWGEWANRPLFNSQGPDPHHSYIPCYQSGDGTIILSAGAAHGVRPGAIYGAYSSNQSHSDPKELQAPGPENVPSFFYAAEEQGYADPIKVFVDGQRPTVDPLTHRRSNCVEWGREIEAKSTRKRLSLYQQRGYYPVGAVSCRPVPIPRLRARALGSSHS
ncbi:hypothetical protein BDN72DRAFT_104968 [Pluteus cervinus]|uniref:Uncharacterized protein n=1 Tax=Pluteus cervinus TaxID=181527 RepID=A0ACD3ANR0_9AGAR|nr:hypothetical protein BDN72DRAFT_104968 [Pluteus cervinus]